MASISGKFASVSCKSDLALDELNTTGVALTDVKTEITDVKTEIIDVKTNLSYEIVDVKAGLSNEIRDVKNEIVDIKNGD